MVEFQVKLRCEEQERLGPLQHSSSLRCQQRSHPLRSRCRISRRALHFQRHHRSDHHNTQPFVLVEALPFINNPVPSSPADNCHLPTCPAIQVDPVVINSSVRSPTKKSSKSVRNGKSGGVTTQRLPTARHSRRVKMRQREYRRLKRLLPSLQEKQEVSKVEVVAEAALYIDDLHERLLHRLKTRGLPQQFKDLPISVDDVHAGNIQDLVHHIMTVTNPASLPPTKKENTRVLPSFITKTNKLKRS